MTTPITIVDTCTGIPKGKVVEFVTSRKDDDGWKYLVVYNKRHFQVRAEEVVPHKG